MKIGNLEIGKRTFIIAELSANHQQNYEIAVSTIKAARDAGVDAIKLQTYTADTMTIDCDNDYFQIKSGTLWDGLTLYKLYEKAYTPWEWQPKLKGIAEDLGLICFSSPFDKTAVDFLESIDVPAYKIASFEITDTPFIEYVASKRKPMIISTGIGTSEEISAALAACYNAGNNDIVLLKCTSSYPAPIEQANLRTIPDMAEKYNVPIGISDHTMGITVPIAAVALGACIVEKHFILDRKMGGPDAQFSLEPDEFEHMIDGIRNVEKALGTITYELGDDARNNRIFSRSLFAIEDIKCGEIFTEANIHSIRPGYGLPPKYLFDIIGKTAKCDIQRGTPLKWELIN